MANYRCKHGVNRVANDVVKEVVNMAKSKVPSKKPSRAKYEQSHPVFSARVDQETYKRLRGHLEGTGCSLSDFLKDALGREESMVEKRVQMLASKKVDPSLEDRVRCLESLVHELWSVAVDTCEYPPPCPHCDNEQLFDAEGVEMESTRAHPGIHTWACPKCGFFVNTSLRIDPKSIEWLDPDTGECIPQPKRSVKYWLSQQ